MLKHRYNIGSNSLKEAKLFDLEKQELITLLCAKSFRYSKEPIFKLVSGRMSNFYINCKPVILSAKGQYLIGNLIYEEIKYENFVAIGGLTFGADAIATAVAFASNYKHLPINAFSIRKEKKGHGTGQWIEGDLQIGDRVVIIDDVATTGGSTIKAIERAREEGLEVVKVVILVDRQEGGIENIKTHCDNVVSIVIRDELMEVFNI